MTHGELFLIWVERAILQVVGLTQVQLPERFKHIRQEGDITHRLSQIIEIGSHKFDLSFDANALGLLLEVPTPSFHPSSASSGKGINWFLRAAIGSSLS